MFFRKRKTEEKKQVEKKIVSGSTPEAYVTHYFYPQSRFFMALCRDCDKWVRVRDDKCRECESTSVVGLSEYTPDYKYQVRSNNHQLLRGVRDREKEKLVEVEEL